MEFNELLKSFYGSNELLLDKIKDKDPTSYAKIVYKNILVEEEYIRADKRYANYPEVTNKLDNIISFLRYLFDREDVGNETMNKLVMKSSYILQKIGIFNKDISYYISANEYYTSIGDEVTKEELKKRLNKIYLCFSQTINI